MKNNDIFVLHLSDLHIRNEAKTKGYFVYSNALKNLITDIKKQTESKDKIILVVSGDIVDQGNYVAHMETAIKFFEKLKEQLSDKVIEIIIVPGNHDKVRSNVNSLVSLAHSINGLNQREKIEDEWDVHLESYKMYFELTKKIYEIFKIDKEATNTFGVELVNIENVNICFICIDSAWCSFSKNDYRKLRVGEYQLLKLRDEYKNLKDTLEARNQCIDLTIAVSHFPLNWLEATEEKMCNDYFLSDNFLDVDILMCGHVHNFSVVNYFNHRHSLLTLVTGIGWGLTEPNEDTQQNHRYSIYSLNLFYNSCDILMRKTKNNGDFDYDYSIYAGEHEVRDNKLRYPLKVKETNAFIRANSKDPVNSKSLFIDNNLLKRIPVISNAIAVFSTSISEIQNKYKQDFVEKIIDSKMMEYRTNDIPTEKKKEYQKNIDIINDHLFNNITPSKEFVDKWIAINDFDNFLAFLNEICTNTIEEIKSCFSSNVLIRAHFRWYDSETDSYHMLCQDSNLPNTTESKPMQSIKWGSLIEPAFVSGEPLIFSANKGINAIQTNWDDFITIIPKFNNYSFDVRVGRRENKQRPAFTFGISIKNVHNKEDLSILYLLGFLKFDEILTGIIDEYMRLFYLEPRAILSEIKRIKNKE